VGMNHDVIRENSKDDFIALMQKNLSKNGYPDKKVSFGLEALYEAADNKGLSLNKVLDELKAQGVDHKKTNEKIIFSPVKATMPDLSGVDSDFLARAQAMMQNMSEEELEQTRSMVTEQLAGMSEAERAQLFAQIKGMGLG